MPEQSTYRRWRPDGWPYCPRCDEDELYSLAEPATIETICGCYRCGPWPIVDPFPSARDVLVSPSNGTEDQGSMRLRVEFHRENGGWGQPNPYLVDAGYEFFLDPNQLGALRIRPADAKPFSEVWLQFDMDRLGLIHRLLLEARSRAKVPS